LVEADITRRVARCRLAVTTLAATAATPGAGRDDYSGPFDPAFRLEHLSHDALVRVCFEFLVQNHLLIRALMLSAADRAGIETRHAVALAQGIGAGHGGAPRLRRALRFTGDGLDAIAAVLRLHPAFVPGYFPLVVEPVGRDRLRLRFPDAPAFDEG